jgi:hypothetical protein
VLATEVRFIGGKGYVTEKTDVRERFFVKFATWRKQNSPLKKKRPLI